MARAAAAAGAAAPTAADTASLSGSRAPPTVTDASKPIALDSLHSLLKYTAGSDARMEQSPAPSHEAVEAWWTLLRLRTEASAKCLQIVAKSE